MSVVVEEMNLGRFVVCHGVDEIRDEQEAGDRYPVAKLSGKTETCSPVGSWIVIDYSSIATHKSID